MSGPHYKEFKTLPGMARAFRSWASTVTVDPLPRVHGADNKERRLLGALGGIANAVAGDSIDSWPAPLRRWARSVEPPPEELIDGVQASLGHGQDPLAVLYDASISAANRRRLGTVFTPPHLVDHMLSLAAEELCGDTPACVVDPGAGVGAFTIAAARRWPKSRILAVDVNPVTLGLLATRIAFELEAYPERSLGNIGLVLEDFLSQLDVIFDRTPGRILVLGNPPYTRVQGLSAAERQRASAASGHIVDSGHANLAVHFQAATLRRLRAKDLSCMVLPGSFGYTRASRGLRRALWSSRRKLVVHRAPATTRAFEGRSVQAAVVLIGAERERRPALRVARLQIERNSLAAVDGYDRSRADEEPENWFWSAAPTLSEESIPLEEIAIVHRGVATGANRMFFLTDDQADQLPGEVCVAGAMNLRGFDGLELDHAAHAGLGGADGRRWLLAIPRGFKLEGELAAYLERHKKEVCTRYLPSQRSPWYSISGLHRPQLLVSPLSKSGFKVVVNTAGAVPSNNLIGVTLRNGEDPKRLAKWLRSEVGQLEMRRLSRRYHGGSHKLEPGDLRAVEIPTRLRLTS